MSKIGSINVYFCDNYPKDIVFTSRGVLLDSLRKRNVRINKEFIDKHIVKAKLYQIIDEAYVTQVFYGRVLNSMMGMPEDVLTFFSGGALSHYEIELAYVLQQGFAKAYDYNTDMIKRPSWNKMCTDIMYDIDKDRYYTNLNVNPNDDGELCRGKIFFPHKDCEKNLCRGCAVVSVLNVRDNYGIFDGIMDVGRCCTLNEIRNFMLGLRDIDKRSFNYQAGHKLKLCKLNFDFLKECDEDSQDNTKCIRYAAVHMDGCRFKTLRLFYKKQDGGITYSAFEMKQEQFDRYFVENILLDLSSIDKMCLE